MFAVGIGNSVDTSKLAFITGKQSNVILVKDYSELNDYLGVIGKILCPGETFFMLYYVYVNDLIHT